MADRFRYTNDRWKAVEAQLTRHGAPTAADRSYLEDAARNYQWFFSRTDPASQEVRAAQECYREIAGHTKAQIRALVKLGSLPTKPSRTISLGLAIAPDPLKAREEYRALLRKLRTLMRWAELSAAGGFPKSASGGSNRARSDVLDDYLRKLLEYWEKRGGHAGKSPGSPAVKFILAAAGPVIPNLEASTVSHFIRDEIDVVRPRRAL
jgi:hypothetical protein